jgi:hypothetical protein
MLSYVNPDNGTPPAKTRNGKAKSDTHHIFVICTYCTATWD